MDKRPYIAKTHLKKSSKRPSRAAMLVALVCAISVPAFLIKHFTHQPQHESSLHPISLPKIIDEGTDSEAEITPVVHSTEVKVLDVKSFVFGITTAAKSKAVAIAKAQPKYKDNEWLTISPRSGDSMAAIFNRLGLSAKNLSAVLQKNPHKKILTAIKPSQKFQFLINKSQLEKLVIPINNIQTLIVYRTGQLYKTKIESKKLTIVNHYVTATVQGSLTASAQKHNIATKLVRQMTDVLGKQVNLTRSVRSGDQFSMVYEGIYAEDKLVGTGNILAMSFTNRGKTYQAIRHKKSNGTYEYFTAKGESFKKEKAFNRYPLKFSHISSTFALSRYHPILRYKRAHKGIDLAAPIGTPIRATGDGVIALIDRHNGYGNMIKIKHDQKYSSIYGHLLRFQKGLSKGSHVTRGQVIGYVGQTGLATGPHCHYELHVNNQPRNPTTIPLPTANPMSGRELASFKANANALLARLKRYEQTQLAAAGKKKNSVG